MADEFPKHLLPEWEGRLILAGVRGSHAWGTVTEDSDKDWFGVWAHPIPFYTGLQAMPESPRARREEDWQSKEGDDDLHVMDVRKFMQHLSRNLPCFHRMLWGGPTTLRTLSTGGRAILDNKNFMLGQGLVRAMHETGVHMYRQGLMSRALLDLSMAEYLAVHGRLFLPTMDALHIREWKRDRPYECAKRCEQLVARNSPQYSGLNDPFTFKKYDELTRLAISQEWAAEYKGGRVRAIA